MTDFSSPDDPRNQREDGRIGLPEGFWTFGDVEERLIEAWGLLARLPDPSRHSGWLRVQGMTLWREVRAEWNDYWQTDEAKRIEGWDGAAPLKTGEVDRMEDALGWIEWVRPDDRKLLGMALKVRSAGYDQLPWRQISRAIGWGGHNQALARRYERAISAIAMRLNRTGRSKD